MFDQRDRTRNISVGDIVLDLAAKTRLLADLALWMIRNGESEIDWEIATGLIARSLSSLPGSAYEPQKVLRMLLERSGLLREPALAHLDFVHRTFQEYLAAWAAVYGDVIGELIRNAHDDQWREVLVMAAGQANEPQTNRLIKGLLRPVSSTAVTIQRLLLAVACLDEVRSLKSELRQAVEEKIPSLLPPRSMDQAELLSKAGERLIPLLVQSIPHNTQNEVNEVIGTIRPTIRAASLIGGPLALDLIETIVTEIGPYDSPIRNELLRAWQYFDPDEYERRVLNLMDLTYIIVDDLPRVIGALPRITSLREILVNPFGDDVVQLAQLANLPHLELLGFASIRARQLQGLAACRQVMTLDLPSFRGENLAGLEIPPNLQELTIRTSNIISLVGTKIPRSLLTLELNDCKELRDVGIVGTLLSLRTIKIRDCPNIDRTGIPATVKVID